MLPCVWNERKYKSIEESSVCLWLTRFFFFCRDSAQHNEEIHHCCCSSGSNSIKMLKFYKARGHRTHSVTHYFPCEACRNKPCLQKSTRSALGNVFMLLSRSPASSITQGIHMHDSELHSDPHCVFLCVCSQRLMNNLSRNNAGATSLAWWNGKEESSLRTANELNGIVTFWQWT